MKMLPLALLCLGAGFAVHGETGPILAPRPHHRVAVQPVAQPGLAASQPAGAAGYRGGPQELVVGTMLTLALIADALHRRPHCTGPARDHDAASPGAADGNKPADTGIAMPARRSYCVGGHLCRPCTV